MSTSLQDFKPTPQQIEARLAKKELVDKIIERFVRYAKIDSQSSEDEADKGKCPSTDSQFDMAKALASELRGFGVEDVRTYPTAHVVAKIPASPGYEGSLPLVLMAHMDTSSDCPGTGVKPVVGSNEDGDIIIRSDGTTLLGADDKAGITTILTALELVVADGIPHGIIEIAFTPDEETGTGVGHLQPEWLEGRVGYTVDGEGEPEVSLGCFNAITVKCSITGKSVHLGLARAKGLVNAALVASALVCALPRNQAPETTDGELGYFCPFRIEGTSEKATVIVLIRDFVEEKAVERARTVEKIAAGVEAQFPGSRIQVEWSKKYGNFESVVAQNPALQKAVTAACERVGMSPVFTKIRGGTDASQLMKSGFALANIFTGAQLIHSVDEYVSVTTMVGTTLVLVEVIREFAAIQAPSGAE